MSRWFRLYEETLDDPKVQLLKPELFKAWVNLLCLTSRNNGVLPPCDQIAFALRMTEERVEEVMSEFISKGLIDETDDFTRPHNWQARQYKSDDSNERVKRYRAKKCNGDVTLHVTPPETETETETDNNSLRSLLPEREKKNGFEKKAIAKDATLSDENLEIAKTHGLKSDQATAEWQKFKAWHLSEGKKSADWDSAWALWVSRRPVQPSTETRQFGSKSPVLNVVPAIDRESSAKDVGKVWIKADTPEWDRAVQRLGKKPPNVGGGWYFDKDILGSAVSH